MRRWTFCLLAAVLGLLPWGRVAAEDVSEEAEVELFPTCEPVAEQLDKYAYLKALSLDLRGVVPSLEEYESLDALDDVPEEWIEQWLGSEEFADRVVRKHRELIWNNVDRTRMHSVRSRLSTSSGVYWQRNRSTGYRGDAVSCDVDATEPAEPGPDGEIVTTVDEDGNNIEGWVWATPYWSPDNPVKICAFDEQDALYSAVGTDCGTLDGQLELDCGCGPDMRWCSAGSIQLPITRAISKDVELRIAKMVLEDQSYLELLTGSKAFVNGPLLYFLRHQTEIRGQSSFQEFGIDLVGLPELSYSDDDTWLEVDLGPEHSGIFTSPVYLMRFGTNRARANRFYNAFLCQPFQAPVGGIPTSDEEDLPTMDLQARAGCKYCHGILEPSAAYWGRWMQGGTGHLEEESFAAFDEDCERCAVTDEPCSDTCDDHYLTGFVAYDQIPYLGWLKSYEFLREDHEANVEFGPSKLVTMGVADGRLPQCVVETASQWLLGAQSEELDVDVVEQWVAGFQDSDFRYSELVRSIVTSESYRRAR